MSYIHLKSSLNIKDIALTLHSRLLLAKIERSVPIQSLLLLLLVSSPRVWNIVLDSECVSTKSNTCYGRLILFLMIGWRFHLDDCAGVLLTVEVTIWVVIKYSYCKCRNRLIIYV